MTAPASDQTHLSASGQLLAVHREQLFASGLSDATIRAAGLRSITAREAAPLLGRLRASPHLAGILFTHVGIDGSVIGHSVRSDRPRVDRRGKVMKYVARKDLVPSPYFPSFVPKNLWTDRTQPLMVTEGAKKALSIAQLGYVSVGLPGVTVAHDVPHRRATKEWILSPCLRPVVVPGRQVYVLFDSDVCEKKEVLNAENRLAAMLQAVGANPMIVRVPGAPGAKTGIDDFLAPFPVELRATQLQRLIALATPWTPAVSPSRRRSVHNRPRYKQRVLSAGLSAGQQPVSVAWLMAQTEESRAAVKRHLKDLMAEDRPRVTRVARGRYVFR